MPERSTVIVVPCYNEAARMSPASFSAFARQHGKFRFLFVDDGSKDDTAALLAAECDRHPDECQLLRLERNSGKAEAVRRGVLHALEQQPEAVAYFDSDLATPLVELLRFQEVLDSQPDYEIVLGSRVRLMGRKIQRRTGRHVLGRVFATCASMVLGIPVYDTQCGAKVFRVTPRLKRVFAEPFFSRWIFDVEILARFLSRSDDDGRALDPSTIYELPLLKWEDVKGSKVKPMDFLKSAIDLWKIHRAYRPASHIKARHESTGH